MHNIKKRLALAAATIGIVGTALGAGVAIASAATTPTARQDRTAVSTTSPRSGSTTTARGAMAIGHCPHMSSGSSSSADTN